VAEALAREALSCSCGFVGFDSNRDAEKEFQVEDFFA
jgi:hypothetical protein